MSKKSQKNEIVPNLNKVKDERETQIDNHILKLKAELEQAGVYDDELLIAVAKIYSNSVLIAYQKHFNVN